MRKRKLLFTMLALALGAFTGGSGAMAQVSSWESVYEQTQTTSDSWTALTSSTASAGMTLGGSGTTSYYYAKETLNLSNSTAGGSGLVIKGTVYLYIPYGVKLTCVGGNASGATGAGAGIELAEGNTLYIIGSGDGENTTVTATGGNAANGGNGDNGTDATGSSGSWTRTGAGGTGGNGGGGAGAGIGTRGGTGGTGGAGGSSKDDNCSNAISGTDGSSGNAGATAGDMGTLYVDNTYSITVVATGGIAGTSGGAGGARGKGYIWDGGNNYTVAGGGGGAGGFGGAASNIGTGGPGGGGGGGGAGGAQDWKGSQLYDVTAYGGNGGTNADGSSAANGAEANTTRTAYESGLVVSEGGSGWDWDDWNEPSGSVTFGSGGSGGAKGNNASNGTQNAGTKTYNITFTPVKTNINGKEGNTLKPLTKTYSPSTSANLVFPKNKDGYMWALLVYGKDCRATGSASIFTTATKTFFGGNYDDEAYRTEVLKDVYGDMEFIEVATTCKLENSGNNTEVLTDFYYNEAIASQKYPITVRLKNRTLYRDNHWNTLCLPFAMTPSQIDLSILQGATIYEMNTTNTGYYPDGQNIPVAMYKKDGPVLFFQFDQVNYTSTGLEAGKPYLVKWATKESTTTDGNYVDNTSNGNSRHEMDFYNVTVTKLAPSAPYGNGVTFQGTFSSSETLTAGDKSKLVFGADDKLYYPSKNMAVGSCRAYFIIPSLASASASEIILNFGDEETTSIQTINFNGKNQDDAPVYNLNGQRVAQPTKGLYIVNGKKVIVK